MKKIELKPCPYCGAEAYRVNCAFHHTWFPLYAVILNDYDTSQEAAKTWNSRCQNV